MRLFGACVLLVVLSFKEIEGSTNFYENIIKAVNSVKAQEDRMAFTPRPPRGQTTARNTASLEQQALDLHQYPRAIREPSPEIDVTLRLGTADTSDVTSRSKTNRRYPSSGGALTIGRTQNNQIQNQEQGGQQEYLREGHVDWLIRQHHDMNQMNRQSGEGNMPTDPLRNKIKQKETRELLMREKAAKKERKRFEKEMALQAENSYYHYGNSYPPNPWDPSEGSGYGPNPWDPSGGSGYGTQY